MRQQALIDYAGFVQFPVVAGAVTTNLASLHRAIHALQPSQHTLIILPELWGTGFAYEQLSHLQPSVVHLEEELHSLATQFNCIFAGSLPEEVPELEGFFYNTIKVIGPDGYYGKYRKNQLFPGEEKAFCAWPFSSSPIRTPHGSFGCMICYDMRFPHLARSQCQQGADLLVCSAQWPAQRIEHFRSLAISRAIENQTYLVACNSVGKNKNVDLGGNSLVISPEGKVLYEAGANADAAVIGLEWSSKQTAQTHFKSFALAPFSVLASMKISSPETCAENAEARYRAGQRVVFIRVEAQQSFSDALGRLEHARCQGDYLVVAVNDLQTQFEDERNVLLPYAGLGCVDSVFIAGKMSAATEYRLKQCSFLTLP